MFIAADQEMHKERQKQGMETKKFKSQYYLLSKACIFTPKHRGFHT